MIDCLILRLETYPQAVGTRPLYECMGYQRTGERALADSNDSHEYCYERSPFVGSQDL
jgi:hypothetical protein